MRGKKFALLLTVMLLLLQVIPVYAAKSPEKEEGDSIVQQEKVGAINSVKVTTEDGILLEVSMKEADMDAIEAVEDMLADPDELRDIIKKLKDSNRFGLDEGQKIETEVLGIVKLDSKDAGKYQNMNFMFDVDGVKEGDTIVILLQKKNGSWAIISPDDVRKQQVWAHMDEISNVALIRLNNVKTDKPGSGAEKPEQQKPQKPEQQKPEQQKPEKPEQDKPVVSPETSNSPSRNVLPFVLSMLAIAVGVVAVMKHRNSRSM